MCSSRDAIASRGTGQYKGVLKETSWSPDRHHSHYGFMITLSFCRSLIPQSPTGLALRQTPHRTRMTQESRGIHTCRETPLATTESSVPRRVYYLIQVILSEHNPRYFGYRQFFIQSHGRGALKILLISDLA